MTPKRRTCCCRSHKTVEGCVGGFVCAIAAAMLYGLVLHLCGYRVQIGLLAIYGFFGSLAGQTGDLAFSAIKREHGVKDYSNLLPGHHLHRAHA